MANILNLRREKKRRARDRARETADANAARHGRTGHEKRVTETERERARREIEGHRLDDDDA